LITLIDLTHPIPKPSIPQSPPTNPFQPTNQPTNQVFGDIMIDYSYVELTSACLTAMRKFARRFPDHRTREIDAAIARGARFIKAVRGWVGRSVLMSVCLFFLGGVCVCVGVFFWGGGWHSVFWFSLSLFLSLSLFSVHPLSTTHTTHTTHTNPSLPPHISLPHTTLNKTNRSSGRTGRGTARGASASPTAPGSASR
jgi:hypothetical protein